MKHMKGVKMMGNEQRLQYGRGADHGGTDTGRKNAKGHQIGQGVDLNAEVHLHFRPALLGAGDLAVKSVAQPAEQQEEAAVIRMPAAGERHNDARCCRQQREIGQDHGIVIESDHGCVSFLRRQNAARPVLSIFRQNILA